MVAFDVEARSDGEGIWVDLDDGFECVIYLENAGGVRLDEREKCC